MSNLQNFYPFGDDFYFYPFGDGYYSKTFGDGFYFKILLSLKAAAAFS